MKYSEEAAFRSAYPLFGINYVTRQEPVMEFLQNKVLRLSSARASAAEGFILSVPRVHASDIHGFLQISTRAVLLRHAAIKQCDCIHSASSESTESTESIT